MRLLQKLESRQGWLLFVLREKWFQAVKSVLNQAWVFRAIAAALMWFV